jgi:hypothetical protein
LEEVVEREVLEEEVNREIRREIELERVSVLYKFY